MAQVAERFSQGIRGLLKSRHKRPHFSPAILSAYYGSLCTGEGHYSLVSFWRAAPGHTSRRRGDASAAHSPFAVHCRSCCSNSRWEGNVRAHLAQWNWAFCSFISFLLSRSHASPAVVTTAECLQVRERSGC